MYMNIHYILDLYIHNVIHFTCFEQQAIYHIFILPINLLSNIVSLTAESPVIPSAVCILPYHLRLFKWLGFFRSKAINYISKAIANCIILLVSHSSWPYDVTIKGWLHSGLQISDNFFQSKFLRQLLYILKFNTEDALL